MTKCITCNKNFSPMGIARHRAMHRDKKEDCSIRFADQTTRHYKFSEHQETLKLDKNDTNKT